MASRDQGQGDQGRVRISCVIPVFNGLRDLERAVQSVLAQNIDLQVVLVDDCSTDGSAQWIVERAKRDPRVVAITLPANHGQGYARNLGVAAAEAPRSQVRSIPRAYVQPHRDVTTVFRTPADCSPAGLWRLVPSG